jgi:hypothetical protein
MYYSELLSSSKNKSKTPWNIIINEIVTASKKKFIQAEFKLSNRNISTKLSASILNNLFINTED